MYNNWKKIYSSSSNYEVELLAAVLKENNIDCVVVNQKDSMYLIGDVELFVEQENELKALEILGGDIK